MELSNLLEQEASLSIGAGPTTKKRPRAAGERPSYPRKRAVQACRTCRLRRTKCDNDQPSCSSCTGLGVECIYQERDASTFDAASLAILHRLEGIEELIRSGRVVATDAYSVTRTPDLASTTRTSMTDHSNVVSPSGKPPQMGSSPLEQLGSEDISYEISVEAILSWPIFRQSFVGHIDLKRLLSPTTSDVDLSRVNSSIDLNTHSALKLFDHYIAAVHIYNPVLEEAKIRGLILNIKFDDLRWDASSCLLLLVYAIGSAASCSQEKVSSSTYSRQSQDFRQADAYFTAAQQRMGILLCRTGAIEAQCFFLAGVYLMCIMRPIEAWRMFVQALACCQGMGHESQNEQERQLQESIYWTCFKSELELRLNLNLAQESVWDLTYPAFFPSPPKALKAQGEVVWYFYLAEIALRRLGNRILNYIYRIRSNELSIKPLDAVRDFEAQANGWLASLPPALKLDQQHPVEMDRSSEEQNTALRFILHGHLLDCYEMMYWPFVVEAIHSGDVPQTQPRSSADQQIYIGRGLHLCSERVDKNEAGFRIRHHGSWLMVRSCTRSALVLVAAARSGKLVHSMPFNWRQSIEKVIELLRYWKGESKDIADRLEILRTQMESL